MGKLAKDLSDILPDFQKFLLQRKLSPEKNAPFLAYWVSRFMNFCRARDVPCEEYVEPTVTEFLDMLRADEKTLDWQPRQADDAIRLYYFHFLGRSSSQLRKATIDDSIGTALAEVVRLIRLRHYSRSTERTYLQWIKRFFAYAVSEDRKLSDLTSSDFKNFLSHLAIKQRVSASTQNQAFNAVLFLYRYVDSVGKPLAETNLYSYATRAITP